MNPTTGAMIGEYSVPTADAGLDQIVSDPADGNLWFTESAADKVGRINPSTKAIAEFAAPTADAAPGAMAVDKNGNIWFTESNASKIAELFIGNPVSITEYVVPGAPGADGPQRRGRDRAEDQQERQEGGQTGVRGLRARLQHRA